MLASTGGVMATGAAMTMGFVVGFDLTTAGAETELAGFVAGWVADEVPLAWRGFSLLR